MSGIQVPAICENCHILFPSPLLIGAGVEYIYLNNLGTKCPICGRNADILDGIYSNIKDSLHVIIDKQGKDAIQKLVDFLEAAYREGMSREQISDGIKNTTPKSSTLSRNEE